jgi:hypothetical protein
MKTTVEIADPLLRKAKKLAAKEGTTLRELVEHGLTLVLAGRERSSGYVMADLRFHGDGLTDEFKDAEWSKFRGAAYEGRGG